jgi:hypothetical protein
MTDETAEATPESAPADATAEPEGGAELPADAAAEGPADALFEALWSRCLDAWDDDKPHGAILEHALNAQTLPELAGRYRKIKDTDEARSARAQKKIDAIVIAATQVLMSHKTPPRTKTPLSWTLSFGLLVVIIVLWLGYKVLGH